MISRTSSIRLLLPLLAAFLSGGCLTLMGGEEKAGAEAARQAEEQMGLVDDPALEAYVREIGERLVEHASRKDVTWRFKIVDMAEPNAFALPGGYVYVSRGLLALTNREDELAGVIGHEIGHVTGHHSNRRVTLTAPFAVVTGVTGWVTGLVSPSLGEAVSGAGEAITHGLVIAPYSRKQERDADRIGAELAALAGWDPAALGDFLEALGREEALTTGRERDRTGWLDTHPAPPERAADARTQAAQLEQAEPDPIARNQADLFRRLDGLLLGHDPAQGVVQDDRFVHPEFRFSITFPEGWLIANTASAVASQDPSASATLVLQIVDRVTAVDDYVAELKEGAGAGLTIERTTVGDLPGAHTQVIQDGHLLDISWIELRGAVYQIVGITKPKQIGAWQATFDAAVQSFRAADRSELSRIRDQRLRIVRARGGEDLEGLLDRETSFWSPQRAAVSNGIAVDEDLYPDRLLKIGRDEPYMPRR
jgi:predicted Zn-dependent protease